MSSKFSAGHWYVIHPVTYYEVRDLSNRVLKDLEEWLEVKCPHELLTCKAKQVFAFKNARNGILEEIKKELARREKRGEVGEEEGYTGEWEVLTDEGKVRIYQDGSIDRADALEDWVGGQSLSRHTQEALEEAAEAGRRAAEEAKILDEWQLELCEIADL